jgi:hypothetical protein
LIERKLYQMTAYHARSTGRKPNGRNQKDGGRRHQSVNASGFWGVEGFLPTRDPDQWIYKSFKIIQGCVNFAPGWVAICDGRQIPIGTATPAEIKIRLDDEIAKLTGVGEVIDLDDWMTAGLPQTNPPVNPRPGAEYGVIV